MSKKPPKNHSQLTGIPESLSELVDNQATDLGREQTLRDFASQPRWHRAWADWHIVRSVLRGGRATDTDLTQRVMDSIASEEQDRRSYSNRGWYAGVGAAAAAVALFFVGGNLYNKTGDAQIVSADTSSVSQAVSSPGAQQVLHQAQYRNELSNARSPYRPNQWNVSTNPRLSSLLQPVALGKLPAPSSPSMSMSWVPPGFQLIAKNHSSLTYSNGQQFFTISLSPTPHRQSIRRVGNLLMYTGGGSGFGLTLVGDISLPTVKRLASSVKPVQ